MTKPASVIHGAHHLFDVTADYITNLTRGLNETEIWDKKDKRLSPALLKKQKQHFLPPFCDPSTTIILILSLIGTFILVMR